MDVHFHYYTVVSFSQSRFEFQLTQSSVFRRDIHSKNHFDPLERLATQIFLRTPTIQFNSIWDSRGTALYARSRSAVTNKPMKSTPLSLFKCVSVSDSTQIRQKTAPGSLTAVEETTDRHTVVRTTTLTNGLSISRTVTIWLPRSARNWV